MEGGRSVDEAKWEEVKQCIEKSGGSRSMDLMDGRKWKGLGGRSMNGAK